MSISTHHLLEKKSNHSSYLKWLFLLAVLFGYAPIKAQEYSPATRAALKKFQKVNEELNNYRSNPGELILNCSYLQDVWLAYLHDAETLDEYQRGMQLFQDHSRHFKSISSYLTTVVNIYHAEDEPPHPERIKTTFNGKEVWGYLNTFKTGRSLTADERSVFFRQEYTKFLRDGISHPFILNSSTIKELETDTVYNFVLMPDSTIFASVERPGKREYHVRGETHSELFLYPNHTVLAGHPEQVVITAGALILHRVDNKSLIFVSSKSGHFQPSYESLNHICTQLTKLGINPCTVIPIPELDMSRAVVKTFNRSKLPILLTQYDTERLFQIASDRWKKFYDQIDREVLEILAKGDINALDKDMMTALIKQRAEATYMRSAYHLFSDNHQSPENFSHLVKQFGKLKGTFKYYGMDKFRIQKLQKKASQVLDLIEKHENEIVNFEFIPADDTSFHNVLNGNISEMHELLSRKSLTLKEYHQLKKLSRETGALFMYMAFDAEFKGKGFLIYRTGADSFFHVNDLMSKTDYLYAEDNSPGETRVVLPIKISNRLIKYLSHLGIAPVTFTLDLDPQEAIWMINDTKDVNETGKCIYNIFHNINKHSFKLSEVLAQLNTLKQKAEKTRNLLLFLDKKHQVPRLFQVFMAQIDRMVAAIETPDMNWIKKASKRFSDLCREAPTAAFKNWECTDKESFHRTLQATLSVLCDLNLKNDKILISNTRAKEIMTNVQAFRDFIHMKKKMRLFLNEQTKQSLPIVYFDILEEHADALLNEVENAIKTNREFTVTPVMDRHAAFILAKVRF